MTFAPERVLNIYEFSRFEVVVSSKLKYVYNRDIQVAKSVEEVAEAIANIRERRLVCRSVNSLIYCQSNSASPEPLTS